MKNKYKGVLVEWWDSDTEEAVITIGFLVHSEESSVTVSNTIIFDEESDSYSYNEEDALLIYRDSVEKITEFTV